MAIRDVNLEDRNTYIFTYGDDAVFPANDLFPSDDLFPVGVHYINTIVAGTMRLDQILIDGNLKFGQLVADKFEVVIYNETDLSGKLITVVQEENGVAHSVFCGRIDSCKIDRSGLDRTIIAYSTANEHRYKNVAPWWDLFWETHTQATIKQVREEMLRWAEVTCDDVTLINDDILVKKNIESTNITLDELLFELCEINCCIPHFNADNTLEFIVLDSDSSTIDIEDKYEGLNSTFEEYVTDKITGINFYDSGNALRYSVGKEGNVYAVSPNVFLLDMTDSQLRLIGNRMLDYIGDIQYTPASVKMIIGDFDYKLGQKVHTVKGDFYILTNSYSNAQLVEETIGATGTKELSVSSVKPSSDQLITNEKIARLNFSLDEVSSELGQFETDTSNNFVATYSKIQQTADEVQSTVMNVISDYSGRYEPTANNSPAMSWITPAQKQVHVEESFYNLDTGKTYIWKQEDNTYRWVENSDSTTMSQIYQNAEQIALRVKRGTISSELSLEPGKVTMNSNRLIINSTAFKLRDDGYIEINTPNFTLNANGSVKASDLTLTDNSGSNKLIDTKNFEVSSNGTITATGVDISGTLKTSPLGGQGELNATHLVMSGSTIQAMLSNSSLGYLSFGISMTDFYGQGKTTISASGALTLESGSNSDLRLYSGYDIMMSCNKLYMNSSLAWSSGSVLTSVSGTTSFLTNAYVKNTGSFVTSVKENTTSSPSFLTASTDLSHDGISVVKNLTLNITYDADRGYDVVHGFNVFDVTGVVENVTFTPDTDSITYVQSVSIDKDSAVTSISTSSGSFSTTSKSVSNGVILSN